MIPGQTSSLPHLCARRLNCSFSMGLTALIPYEPSKALLYCITARQLFPCNTVFFSIDSIVTCHRDDSLAKRQKWCTEHLDMRLEDIQLLSMAPMGTMNSVFMSSQRMHDPLQKIQLTANSVLHVKAIVIFFSLFVRTFA
jgi:hypothetical protein